MNCEPFFELVDEILGDRLVRPRRTETGGQCVVDFFHPLTAARLGDDSLVTAFNRSGVVWAPPARRLGIQLRIPEEREDAVAAVLRESPFAVERTDHRGASAPDGEMVMLVHYSVRATDVNDQDLQATLSTVAAALDVAD
ncbi:hypothetical protein [Salinigranum sp. GCM10025319]|uniref:hypothetical protein n=1 Tax=Salinigranum sp. GCM10025319 TaxID=3252687 RepID=UPI003616C747